jgi:hypothetical protein
MQPQYAIDVSWPMSKAKSISTQADYEGALPRINALMGATPRASS